MVEYDYGPAGGVNDRLSRVQSIVDVAQPPSAGSVLATYSYLGDGTIVRVEHPEVAGGLTLSYGYRAVTRAYSTVIRTAVAFDIEPGQESRRTRIQQLEHALSQP